MRSHGCINGTLQDVENYSSPVPVIGLYIAAAFAVCVLLMLYDIVVFGFIKSQKWLSCKWFKLNSVSLSLIGVVVKLTVDLTTSMPSALDQLSKLAGTASLCIYMCYIYPSVSDMKDSTNMFALSILVVTVFVNMCIQLSTGVIALFFCEHIIVLCTMLVLLVILWHNVFSAKNVRRNFVATNKSEFMAGKSDAQGGIRQESFLQRLKCCYLHTYEVNPQFRACRSGEYGIVSDMSLVSLVVLIQAAIRSIVYKKEILCTGELSDYQWSMGMIVVAQFVFIIIGSFASCFRRWTMLIYLYMPDEPELIVEEPYLSNPIIRSKLNLLIAVDMVYCFAIFIHFALSYYSVSFCLWVLSSMRKAFSRIFIMVKYFASSGEERLNSESDFESFWDFFEDLTSSIEGWIEQKGKSSMEKLIDGSRGESIDLSNLLSSIDPSLYQGPPQEILDLPHARLHPLVVLVRLAEVAIPESPYQDRITKTFKKAFETLHFIEKHMHNTTLEDIKETEIAKALWRAGDFSRLLPADCLRSSNQLPPVEHAFTVMRRIYLWMEKLTNGDSVTVTVKSITCFLNERGYYSVDELGDFMQNLFAYMLNAMLAQLPDATFKAVSQSSDDEFEDCVRQSLKHFSLLQSWDGIHTWKLPQGLENCTGLLDPEERQHHSTITDDDGIVENSKHLYVFPLLYISVCIFCITYLR